MEATFAMMLRAEGIEFGYESQTWELVPRQTFQGETLKAVTYTPDFTIGDVVVEIKGWRNDVYPLKRKLIAAFIKRMRPDTIFIEANSPREMREAITRIKQKQTGAWDTTC